MNPVLKAMLIVALVVFLTLAVVLTCVFKRYNNLKVKYSKLGESDNDNPAGEIEMQTR